MTRRRTHQPRIRGVTRIPSVGSLHPDVREGLASIAADEGRSLSWVVAEILSAFFGVDCATGQAVGRTMTAAPRGDDSWRMARLPGARRLGGGDGRRRQGLGGS